jgi:hypothetical protein
LGCQSDQANAGAERNYLRHEAVHVLGQQVLHRAQELHSQGSKPRKTEHDYEGFHINLL